EERRQSSPPFTNKHEIAAGFWQRAGNFRECKCTAKREQPTHDPDHEHWEWSGQAGRNDRGRPEDARTDGGADKNGNGAPQPELARKLACGCRIRGFGHSRAYGTAGTA